jgi:LysR family pca operon transcriptional activator
MRQLRCFLAVAQVGTVTRAAEELGTVQPSVSRSIRELEEALGAPLFDRTGRRLELNAAGQTLHAYVSNGLGQIDHGLAALRDRMQSRRVAVYALPNVVRLVMPGAVRRFKAARPEVDLDIETVSDGLFAERLRAGDVDFAFGRLHATASMEGLTFESLYREPLVFAVHRTHPLADRAGLDVADVDRFQVVLPRPGTIIRDEIDRFLLSLGRTRFTNTVVTVSGGFVEAYLEQGEAVVCHPYGGLRRLLDSGEAVRIDFGRGQLDGAVGFSSAIGKALSRPATDLMKAIRDEVAALGLS